MKDGAEGGKSRWTRPLCPAVAVGPIDPCSSVHLTSARLCLNCEEIHDAQACPACASENFAFLTQWVPSGKRHRPRRVLAAARAGGLNAGAPAPGFLTFWLGRWSRRLRARVEGLAAGDTGELR